MDTWEEVHAQLLSIVRSVPGIDNVYGRSLDLKNMSEVRSLYSTRLANDKYRINAWFVTRSSTLPVRGGRPGIPINHIKFYDTFAIRGYYSYSLEEIDGVTSEVAFNRIVTALMRVLSQNISLGVPDKGWLLEELSGGQLLFTDDFGGITCHTTLVNVGITYQAVASYQ